MQRGGARERNGRRQTAATGARLLLLFLLATATVGAAADGFVAIPVDAGVSQTSESRGLAVAETGQRAIILWRDGRETLVLQVNYRGPLARLAWLIPVPARPSPQDLFLAREQFVERLFAVTAPQRDRRFVQVKGLSSRAWPLAGVLPSLALVGGIARAKSVGLGAPAEGVSTVRVYQTLELGPYELTVLGAEKATDLKDWLKHHRFALPSGLEEVVQGYLDRGWYFVAARGRSTGQGGPTTTEAGALPPLGVCFAAPRPVYPLRISRLSAPPRMALRLLVLAPRGVEANGLPQEDIAEMTRQARCWAQEEEMTPDRARSRWAGAHKYSAVLCEGRAPLLDWWREALLRTSHGARPERDAPSQVVMAEGREVDVAGLVATRYWALLQRDALEDLEFDFVGSSAPGEQAEDKRDTYFIALDRAWVTPAAEKRRASVLWPLVALLVAWAVGGALVGPLDRYFSARELPDQRVRPRPLLVSAGLVGLALLVLLLAGSAAGILLMMGAGVFNIFGLLVVLLPALLLPPVVAGHLTRDVPSRRAAVSLALLVLTWAAIGSVCWTMGSLYAATIMAAAFGAYLLMTWLLLVLCGRIHAGRGPWPLAAYLGLLVGVFFGVAEGAALEFGPSADAAAQAYAQARAQILQALDAFARDNGCLPATLEDLTASKKPRQGVDTAGNPVPLSASGSWRGPYLAALPEDPITGRRDSWAYEPTGDLLVDSRGWAHPGLWVTRFSAQ